MLPSWARAPLARTFGSGADAMITVGIDLAAEPKQTGGCAISWRGGAAEVLWAKAGLTDADILASAQGADAIGIDAPFGWPTFFVEAIAAHHARRSWPAGPWETANRRRLRLRTTDEYVKALTGLSPMSVSSDRIAIPATRCAGLIDRLGVVDRSGDGRVFEVYPAAALFQWGLVHRGYKGQANLPRLRELVAALEKSARWLELGRAHRRICVECDHAFDALVASLAARAAWRGLTARPSALEMRDAQVEGWIAVPRAGTLDALP
jgi:predicted nuclease with RNAse H fold